LLILIVCLLGFGLQIPSLGFYWDDYASIYVYRQHGTSIFSEWTAGQGRPLGGLIIGQLWDLFGVNPLPWHMLNLVLYIASVGSFWGILRLLWGEYRTQTTLIALLFAVYPSYHLRPIPISFSLIISLVIVLLSFGLMIWAVKRKNHPLNFLAAMLIPAHPFIYEQNIGYELLRPLVIVYVVVLGSGLAWRDWRGMLRAAAPYWLPHVAWGCLFVIYRGVIFQPNETYATYNTPANLASLDSLLLMLKLSLAVPTKLLITDWATMPWRLFVGEKSDGDIPGTLAIIVLTVCLVYLWRFQRGKQAQAIPSGKTVLGVGIVGFGLIGILMLAVHLVGRVLEPGFNSRWALSPSPLAALVVGLGIPYLLGSALRGQLLLTVLVALGLSVQVAVNQEYAADWKLRQDLWWQMRWRAPALESGTMILFVNAAEDGLAFGRTLNDYELTGHSNLFYVGDSYPAVVAGEVKLAENIFIKGSSRSGVWSEVTSKRRIIFRDWAFDLNKLVVFGYNGGCLVTADPFTLSQAMPDQDFLNLAPHHNSQLILDSAPMGVEDMLNPPPNDQQNWCFYYQRIQFALQLGKDDEAERLADQALAADLKPEKGHEVEWVPVIETYDRAGRYEEAERLIFAIAFSNDDAQRYLCERLRLLTASEAVQNQMRRLRRCLNGEANAS
jgi:hypothetical protein